MRQALEAECQPLDCDDAQLVDMLDASEQGVSTTCMHAGIAVHAVCMQCSW